MSAVYHSFENKKENSKYKDSETGWLLLSDMEALQKDKGRVIKLLIKGRV